MRLPVASRGLHVVAPLALALVTLAVFAPALSNGKGAMPAWKSHLSDEDRWRLVAFVRTFRTR